MKSNACNALSKYGGKTTHELLISSGSTVCQNIDEAASERFIEIYSPIDFNSRSSVNDLQQHSHFYRRMLELISIIIHNNREALGQRVLRNFS